MNESKMLVSMFLAFLMFIGSSHKMIVDAIIEKNLKNLIFIVFILAMSVLTNALLYNM